jgi:hypothetical protein
LCIGYVDYHASDVGVQRGVRLIIVIVIAVEIVPWVLVVARVVRHLVVVGVVRA